MKGLESEVRSRLAYDGSMIRTLAILWLAWAPTADAGQCDDLCPDGTNLVNIDYTGAIVLGTVIVEEDGCIAHCEPFFPCNFPNVPVVTANQFTCAPLEGYATVPAVADIDTAFGTAWEELVDPVGTSIVGGYTQLAVVDLDGDFREDLVYANGYEVSVRFSNGDGSFGDAFPTGIADYLIMQIEAGDFDGDGLGDIAIRAGGLFQANWLTVHHGDGLGGFDAGVQISADAAALAAPVDFDGDGRDDLLSVYPELVVRFSEGGAVFTSIPLPWGSWSGQDVGYLPADVDGDGDLDIAIAAEGGSISPNLDGRTFGAATTNANGVGGAAAVAVGDATGNGVEDLYVWDADWGIFRAYRFDPSSGFVDLNLELKSPTTLFSDRRGDVDGDGSPDSVTNGLGSVSFLASRAGEPLVYGRPSSGSQEFGAIDVDGDGLYEAFHGDSSSGTIWTVFP